MYRLVVTAIHSHGLPELILNQRKSPHRLWEMGMSEHHFVGSGEKVEHSNHARVHLKLLLGRAAGFLNYFFFGFFWMYRRNLVSSGCPQSKWSICGRGGRLFTEANRQVSNFPGGSPLTIPTRPSRPGVQQMSHALRRNWALLSTHFLCFPEYVIYWPEKTLHGTKD